MRRLFLATTALGFATAAWALTPGVEQLLFGGQPRLYADSVNGNDANSGRSPAQAKATIAGLVAADSANPTTKWELARGSYWREKIVLPRSGMTVESYGSGALPILDGADVVSTGAWSKTAGYTNIYQATLPVDVATNGTSHWPSIWEDGTRLQEAASLAALDSAPGKYYAAATPLTDTVVHYVHATGSGNPASNGKSYEYSRRWTGVSCWDVGNCTLVNVQGQRQYSSSGSITLGQRSVGRGVRGYQGNAHNVWLRGWAECHDCIADEAYAKGSAAIPFVAFESVATTDMTLWFDGCVSKMTTANPDGFVGYLFHAGGSFGTVTYSNDTTQDVASPVLGAVGFEGANAQQINITNGVATNVLVGAKTSVNTSIDGFTQTGTQSGGGLFVYEQPNQVVSIANANAVVNSGGGYGVNGAASNQTLTISNSTITGTGAPILMTGASATVSVSGLTANGIEPYVNIKVDHPAAFTSDNNAWTWANPAITGFATLDGVTYTTLALAKARTGQELHSTPISYFVNTATGNDGAAGTTPATAWATNAKADTAVLHTGQDIVRTTDGTTWATYRSGPYNPNNYLQYSEPTLTQWYSCNVAGGPGACVLPSGAVAAAFAAYGLSNGVAWPNVSNSANSYVSAASSTQLAANTAYTISAYVQRDDGGAVTRNEFMFRLGGVAGGVGVQSCSLVTGALYRCWQTITTGSTPTQTSNGVARSANPNDTAMGFTGFQINLGSSPATYSATP